MSNKEKFSNNLELVEENYNIQKYENAKNKNKFVIKNEKPIFKIFVIKYLYGNILEFYDINEYNKALNDKNAIDNYKLTFYEEFAGLSEVITIKRKNTETFMKAINYKQVAMLNPELSYILGKNIWQVYDYPFALEEYYNVLKQYLNVFDDPYKYQDEQLNQKKEKLITKVNPIFFT